MQRQQRNRILLLVGLFTIGIILYFSNGSDATTNFRKNTEAGLAKAGGSKGGLSDEALTQKANKDLKHILADPGRHPNSENWAESWADEDISVAGRKTMPKPGDKAKYPTDDAGDEVALNGDKAATAGDSAKDLGRKELMKIFKKGPMVIFSKSYCPFCKRTKELLLETYTIAPPPHVVELDLLTETLPLSAAEEADGDHPKTLGRQIQELLADMTGHKTVPNVMVNMHSIGGSDDVLEMHHAGVLVGEVLKHGGKRIVGMELS